MAPCAMAFLIEWLKRVWRWANWEPTYYPVVEEVAGGELEEVCIPPYISHGGAVIHEVTHCVRPPDDFLLNHPPQKRKKVL